MSAIQAAFMAGFRNEPLCDFSDSVTAGAMQHGLQIVSLQLGQYVPDDLSDISTRVRLFSMNPARPSQIVGIHPLASAAEAELAVSKASAAFPAWSRISVDERAVLLKRTAAKLRDRRMEFSAWLVLEAGKNWIEADADTAEAIDFLEYYALQAELLANVQPSIQFPGEHNRLRYLPLGVGVVIPPWNFPLAIMAGMTCAAIVTGNTVVLKPSPLTPNIAARFHALLLECGLPPHVVTLVQGGPEFGDALVHHPDVRFIAFTGSKEVGLHIHAEAAKIQPGQIAIKRTILELGGKNAIIVEADADLDAAASGVIASAFGFNGQKCSACSLVIVAENVRDAFIDRLRFLTSQLTQGDPVENFNVGPVINEAAYERILGYIDQTARRGTIISGGKALTGPEQGYYIQPTIVAGLASEDPVCREEIFGPVLAVLPSSNFAEALRIANATEYGLTGAIYSSSEEILERAAEEFHVGNLYLNRKCTGAMVGAHPFGGFKLSGTDSKAGGPDYLLLFTQAKSIGRRLS